MNRIVAIALLVTVGLFARAQCPSEWLQYTTSGYFYDVESAQNEQNLPEASLKSDLLDLARANLSKQIEVRVNEVSRIDKNVVNGNTDIRYTSQRHFTTDVDMKLAETRSIIDRASGKMYVIAYINKEEACNYYRKELQMLLSNVDQALEMAKNYINTGFKTKAKDELGKALPLFEQTSEPFFWFNVFGMDESQMSHYLDQVHQKEQSVKAKLAELEHGVTYCVVCSADNFGKNYPKLKNELKGELSKMGCNFVDDPASADYVIRIEASTREYNQMNTTNGSAYFGFVDATIAIDKNATGQRIFEDEISVKGSHTISFEEAGRDGYKKVSKEISNLLKENIEL